MTFIVTRIVFWGSTKKKNDKLKLCPENRKKKPISLFKPGPSHVFVRDRFIISSVTSRTSGRLCKFA